MPYQRLNPKNFYGGGSLMVIHKFCPECGGLLEFNMHFGKLRCLYLDCNWFEPDDYVATLAEAGLEIARELEKRRHVPQHLSHGALNAMYAIKGWTTK
jgi:hypothetical protein